MRSIDQFFDDADAGTLPGFCIVDPDFDEYSEENPQDVRKGESFAAEVINRVMHGKGWRGHAADLDLRRARRLLRPRRAAAGRAARRRPGRSLVAHRSLLRSVLKPLFPGYVRHAEQLVCGCRLRYDTYGVRVPAVIVSPYRPAGLRAVGGVRPHLGAQAGRGEVEPARADPPRRRAPARRSGALDLSAPPAFLTPPALPAPGLAWGSW